MPRVIERLRNPGCHSVRECVFSASVEETFSASSAYTAFPVKGNVIQSAEGGRRLLEGTFFMVGMKESDALTMIIYTSDLTLCSVTSHFIFITHVCSWVQGVGGGGGVHPRGLSAGPELVSSHNPLWKKRACH